MKRIISTLLILMMMLPPMVLPAEAATLVQADSVVRITADKAVAAVGDTVTVTVAFENISACGAVDFNLVYDTEYLQEPAKSDVTMNIGGIVKDRNPAYIVDAQTSQEYVGRQAVKVVAAGDSNCLKGSSGTLFTVKFKVKKEAPAPGIPLEFFGTFNNLYSNRDMRNTVQVVNTHIATANPTKTVTAVTLPQDKGPTKTQYVQGQALNLEGGRLLVTYSDKSTQEVHLSLAQVTQYNFNALGTQTVKAKYAGKDVSFDIQTEASALSSISIGQVPTTLEYIQGKTAKLDESGGVLLLYYTGGIVKTLDISDSSVTLSGYNKDALGVQKIKVQYGGFETEYKIAVVKKAISDIDVRTPMVCETCGVDTLDAFKLIQAADKSVDPYSMKFSERLEYIGDADNHVVCGSNGCQGTTFTPKMKMVYFVGEPFDVGNAKLFVTYSGGTTEEIDMTLDMVDFKNTIATTQNVEVAYGAQWMLIKNVRTRKKEATGITVVQEPKTQYVQGQSFDPTGGIVHIKYDDGSEVDLPMNHADVRFYYSGMNELGEHRVTVFYESQQTYFKIKVIARAVQSIAVAEDAKSTYIQGEELNPDTKLYVTYNDGETETAYLRNATVTGYKPNQIGPQRVTVTYGKQKFEWPVTVAEKVVTKLELVGAPPATILEGLDLNLEHCTLTATYNDGEVKPNIPITPDIIKTFNKNQPGEQTVTLIYEGGNFSFKITVIEKEVVKVEVLQEPDQTEYLEGKDTALNLAGGEILVTYNNEKTEPLAMDAKGVTVSGYDPNKVGEQTVTVTYGEKSATFKVNVRAKTATSINVSTKPKTEYLEGKDTALNLAGGKLTVEYDNGKSETINLTDPLVTVSGFKKEIGTHTIKVTYQGLQTSFHIEVKAKEISGIALAAMPTKTLYRQGVEKFNPAGGKLTVFYNNDTKETVDLSAATIRGFSNLFAGDITLTATYEGYTVELTVMILAENPFKDVQKTDYFETPVLWAVTKGITNGIDATQFAPDANCTRGQIVTFLWRAAGEPAPKSAKNPFKDVKKGEYYYNAVLWAVENGITNGMDATHFAPDATCTRGQVATFLWRAAGKPAPASTQNPFVDIKKGEYYYDAVLWAVENGITNGMGDNKFAPNTTCTRGQIVTFLYRAYK